MNQSSISRQNALIEALNRVQAIIEFDLQGNIQHANELFLATMGYTLDELLGQHHKIFCDPTYVNTIGYSQFWSKLAKGETYSGEFHRYDKEGNTVWLHASYNPVMGDDGKPIRIVKFATDITAEKLRRANDEGKMNAIDRVQAVIEFSLDGKVLTANQNFLQIFGYSMEQISGQHHRLFCTQEEARSAEYLTFWERLGRGESETGIYRRLDSNGKDVWIQASYNPVFDPDGKPYKVV